MNAQPPDWAPVFAAIVARSEQACAAFSSGSLDQAAKIG